MDYRVPYGDTDAQGVVYYGTYYRFFEIARNEFFRSLGLEMGDLAKNNVHHLVRNLNADYFAPAHFDDLLEIETKLLEKRNSSFKLGFEVKNKKTEKLLNKAEIVYVFIDKNFKKAPIPDKINKVLSE